MKQQQQKRNLKLAQLADTSFNQNYVREKMKDDKSYEKIEDIIDNIDLLDEVDEAAAVFEEVIKEYSLSRRSAFFGCIEILKMYGRQKRWDADELKKAICAYIDIQE